MKLTLENLYALQAAVAACGEKQVTLAMGGSVITFEFNEPDGDITEARLTYESQPSRKQLSAMLGVPEIAVATQA